MVKKEQRYITIKMKDAEKYLDLQDSVTLSGFCQLINIGRKKEGKAPLDCVVVEHDWPMFESTWNAVLHEAERQEKLKNCKHNWVEVDNAFVSGVYMCTLCHTCKGKGKGK